MDVETDWCEPDGCPPAICGGPHVRWENDAGDQLVAPVGVEPPLPGFRLMGSGVSRPRGQWMRSGQVYMAPAGASPDDPGAWTFLGEIA